MCHCLSFLAYPYPSISQRWASWKRELLLLIERIVSYNGPFTGFQVQRISIQGSITSYLSTGARVHLTLTMGTCMSSSSSSSSSSTVDGGAAQNKILSTKRKQQQLLVVQDLAASTPPSTAPSKRPRDKIRTEATESAPSSAKEIRAPKKVCANGASNFACLFSQQGRKGLNQDAMIVWEDFGCQEDAVFCGVFDGHGPFGHLVAQSVRDLLPPKLASILQTCSNASAQGPMFEASKYDEKGANKGSIKDTGGCQIDSKLLSVWKESFLNAYMLMDKELQKKPNVNCYCSGTTAVTLVKQGNDVIIGNVGDSRAVLGTKSDEGSIIAVQLTVDLKPNLPQEAERIRQCRGRVFALQDEPDVHRVWLPHDNSPGLAMARAFGDFCLKNFGVIAVPEVTHHRLTDRDQFIVLATDGIWDVLSNEEVVDIVSSVSARPLAARTVVEMAVLAWRSKFPTSKVDDCAVVCLFTNDILAVPSAQSFLKRSMLATRRKRSVSAVSLKFKTTECSDVNTSKVSQCTVLPSIKAGMSGMSHSHSEQGEGIFKAEVDVASQNFTEVEPIQKLSCESLGKPLKSAPNQAGNSVNAEVESDGLLEAGQREEWSALDGVTRVNSLVNLPRFTPGDARGGG